MYKLNKSILDYEQLLEKLDEIVNASNGKIKKNLESPKTDLGYEIPHYSVGNGNKHVVIVGGVHGNEIISVDFVLKVMEDIALAQGEFKDLDLNEFTLDILPIDNPEGYIIVTSAIRTLIPRNMSDEDIESIAFQYYKNFREDNIEAISEGKNNIPVEKRSIKKHHQMFKNASYNCISDKHALLKENVKKMMEAYDFPEGCMIDWKANGSGVEPNKSYLMNSSIYNIKKGLVQWGYNNFNTIRNNVPGPMGVPTIDPDNFKQTIESKYIDELINKLVSEKKYCGFISYHGTGGYLEYEPSFEYDETIFSDDERYRFTGIDYEIAKNYIEKTTSPMVMPDKTVKEMTYGLVESDSTAVDEYLRILNPAQILVELSKAWGGNPIAPYGNRDAYNTTINCNKKALASTIKLMGRLKPLIDENAYFEWNDEESDKSLRPYKYK